MMDWDEEYVEELGECGGRAGNVIYRISRDIERGNIHYFIGMPEPMKKDSPKIIKIRKFNDETKELLGVCRISVDRPEYIEGYNENMRLEEDVKEEFIEILKEKHFVLTNLTIWEYIFDSWNHESRVLEWGEYYDVQPMPDYSKLPL